MKKTPEPASDPKESVEANPHPASSHRGPSQIAADTHGATKPKPTQTRPVSDIDPEQHIDAESASDTERRRAVKRSAHKGP